MDKFKKVKAIGNVIGFNIDASGKETYNVQFPDMTIAELESYQFEDADAYRANEKPLYLRNVLARLRELPEHDRKVWMDEIMHEFANDYGSVKYTLGYERGKFDGAVEAEKSNKVVIPQFVADWIDYCKENHFTITGAFDPVSEYGIGIAGTFKGSVYKCTRWALDNQNLFARAWLDGYEVEQEKRYKIYIKSTGQALFNDKGNLRFMYKVHADNTGFLFTKSELEEANLGWVFDCEGVEVLEVEE